jgi:DNA helicase II / ATP-dependent DNA helicase PcrA
MADLLREPGLLTAHQLPAVHAERDVFLTACPGSGKTKAGGVRVARLADDGFWVAACSYTNVGVEQIRRVLAHDLGITLGPRHFIGTLHAFLLRYVLDPFGHLVTGSATAPRLVADDASWPDVGMAGDNRFRLPLWRFRFLPDGGLCVRSVPERFKFNPEDAARIGQANARRMKASLARRGRVSFDDAMYWALRVLRDHPTLAGRVAARFDELLVDEAQDTSELQLACLHELSSTGCLRSLTLIGDLEQSICSYTGASRTGCEALTEARGLTPIPFTENHRSSQRICDVAVHFCARSTPDRAVGEDAHCPWAPALTLYPPDDPARAVAVFRTRLTELGHNEHDAAVLARSNNLVDDLNGQTTPVPIDSRPLAIGRAVGALRGTGTLGRRELEAVDRILAFAAWDSKDLSLLTSGQRWSTRQASMQLLAAAPELTLDLRTWIRDTRTALSAAVRTLVPTPAHEAGQILRSASGQDAYVAGDVIVSPNHTLRAQTVHDIKGESRGAVLVVVDRLRSRRRGAQSALWSRPLLGQAVSAREAEELRIAFVAITRARRFCMLALPTDSSDDVINAFEAAGFQRLTQ